MTELATPQQPEQQEKQQPEQPPQKRYQVGLAISSDLNHRCFLRQHQDPVEVLDQQDSLLFDRHYWLTLGVDKELQGLLASAAAQLPHCQEGRCKVRSLANALVNISDQYFASILKRFSATEAIGVPDWVRVHQQPSEYFSVSDEAKGTLYYLQAEEIAQLVIIISEAVAAALTAGYADVTSPGQTADQLPAIRPVLNEYGYASAINLPINNNSKRKQFQRARYWTDAHRFFLAELQLQPLSDIEVCLSYCLSPLKWYCAPCLSHRIEGLCKADKDQR